MKLYKRNAQGKPIVWEGVKIDDKTYQLFYGLVGGNLHTETVGSTYTSKVDELESLIKAKRKAGYKSLEDLYDNSPSNIRANDNLLLYLNTYLPKYNNSNGEAILPMLAKTLETNKPFEKGNYAGQWKINGLRCIIGAVKANDFFSKFHLTFHSREGTEWHLNWLEDLLAPKLEDTELLELMLNEGACLDGELYLPGYTVNDINSFVKNPATPFHDKLQYWCYDIAVENFSAEYRYELLELNLGNNIINFKTKEEHLNNKHQLVVLPNELNILDFNDAVIFRNRYIDLGFEGLILRNEASEYCFGSRKVNHMYKFKRVFDGIFKIIDIIPEGKKRSNLCKFILRNDINGATFECILNAPQAEQERILVSKNSYIGNYLAYVEYRERSGVRQVPFHAKIVKLVKYES